MMFDEIQLPSGLFLGFQDSSSTSSPSDLSTVELACLSAQASPKRRGEFISGRLAAHEALRHAGAHKVEVLRDKNGTPQWPKGYLGSISHCQNKALAIVGRKSEYVTIGCDLEQYNRTYTFDIGPKICSELEYRWINEDAPQVAERTTLLFSAKESIFKAIFPLYQRMFWFRDAELEWREPHSFTAKLNFKLEDFSIDETRLIVHVWRSNGYCLSLIAIPGYAASLC